MTATLTILPAEPIEAGLAHIESDPRLAHMRPLYLAMRDAGVRLAFILHGDEPIELLTDQATIFLFGDDTDKARGPMAFSKKAVRAAARASVGAVIVAGAPDPAYYAIAAGTALGARVLMQGDEQVNGSVIIVETLPYQERAWADFLKRSNPSIAILICTTHEDAPAC